ncbi:MAG TPA: hypothetical protein VF631_06985 [Allosphingosinicella sp.]|jgi:hypothetical protein|uniref:hypothetical protein n=1 Tax=Allosphingosinicella sp. TaxID=2823234 RepID=UPI002F2AD281
MIGQPWLVAAAAAQAIMAVPAPLALRAGTPVPLVTATEVNSKTHRQGARFDLTVSEDVRVGSHVVIPKGAVATAEVARHVASGALAKSGRLEIQLLFVTVGDRRIRLDGTRVAKGPGATGSPAMTGVALVAISSLLQGKNASIPAGTAITGYVHRDLPLAVGGLSSPR